MGLTCSLMCAAEEYVLVIGVIKHGDICLVDQWNNIYFERYGGHVLHWWGAVLFVVSYAVYAWPNRTTFSGSLIQPFYWNVFLTLAWCMTGHFFLFISKHLFFFLCNFSYHCNFVFPLLDTFGARYQKQFRWRLSNSYLGPQLFSCKSVHWCGWKSGARTKGVSRRTTARSADHVVKLDRLRNDQVVL